MAPALPAWEAAGLMDLADLPLMAVLTHVITQDEPHRCPGGIYKAAHGRTDSREASTQNLVMILMF